ncbi:MAG: 3-hydroxyacyl-CoA dehydrogenase family protein [Thermoguttaceae bacterium]
MPNRCTGANFRTGLTRHTTPTHIFSMHISIIGAGLMGRAIAAEFVGAGCAVTLYDVSADVRAFAAKTVTDANVVETLDAALAAPVVIETIVEKPNAKKRLYRQIVESASLPPDALLLTNTSTIPISTLRESVPRTENFCGFHFFHPVAERPLVEIIPHTFASASSGRGTSTATLETARQLAIHIGKEPIIVGDSPGFLVNRLLHPYLTEAILLAENAVNVDASFTAIDAAAVRFGMAKGPFTLMDEIGLDTVLHGGFVMAKALPERAHFSPLLEDRVRAGRLGLKTRDGFYSYDENGNRVVRDYTVGNVNIEKLLRAMYAEALRCHAEGVIDDLSLANTASVKGLGFPSSRGGIVSWGQT